MYKAFSHGISRMSPMKCEANEGRKSYWYKQNSIAITCTNNLSAEIMLRGSSKTGNCNKI